MLHIAKCSSPGGSRSAGSRVAGGNAEASPASHLQPRVEVAERIERPYRHVLGLSRPIASRKVARDGEERETSAQHRGGPKLSGSGYCAAAESDGRDRVGQAPSDRHRRLRFALTNGRMIGRDDDFSGLRKRD